MSFIEIFRAIFINIKENKFKVFLTSLGIIVGALTIVLVVAIGEGSQADVKDQFKSLNVGTISISSAFGRKTTQSLEPSLVQEIKEGAPSVKEITITARGNADVAYYQTSQSASVIGTTEPYQITNNLVVEYGRFITDEENEKKRKVVVIGAEIASLLFEEQIEDAIGKDIIIKGKRYEVIGVLQRLGDSMQGFNPDEGVIVPYEVAKKYIFGKNAKSSIVALAQDINHVSTAIDEITQVLQKKYKEKSDEFMIRDAGSRLVAAKDSAKTMTLLLMAVATIVLIVGGIGIMNVLFVSVKERTKEIGILKAIGARKRDILLQFLLEAIVISASGGIGGILLSMLVMPLMKYADIRAIPSLNGYLLAFLFSIATGTFFGYYPALKAASLRPIEALNYE